MSLLALQKRLTGGSPRIYWREADYSKLASIYGVDDDAVAKLAQPQADQPVSLPTAGTKATGDTRKAFRFTLSDGSIDRMNDIVHVDGISLLDYYCNPTVLLNHNPHALPIGRSTSIGLSGGRLSAEVELVTEASSLAERVRALISAGVLKAASIGFIPLKFSYNQKRGGFDFHETSLLEWSVVTTPALPTALIEPGQTGKAMSEHEWREQELGRAKRQRQLTLVKLKGG